MVDYGSNEMTMTAEDIVLSQDSGVMGNVVYRFDFKIIGIPDDFEVEITDVDVEEIKNPVYDEDGSPVMMNEADRQKFTQAAIGYFWKNLIDRAESKAIERVQWGLE